MNMNTNTSYLRELARKAVNGMSEVGLKALTSPIPEEEKKEETGA
jgi:hypothetical protein